MSYKFQNKPKTERKTIPVVALVRVLNNKLRGSSTLVERKTVIAILEDVLHCTAAYRGFTYLEADQLPAGVEPGIVRDAVTSKAISFPDDTRRFYFI